MLCKKNILFLLIAICLLSGLSSLCLAEERFTSFLNGRVTSVHDGDTVTVKMGSESIKIRFYGIDCPESELKGRWEAQPYSAEAKAFVSDMVLGKLVSVRLKGEESYGRVLGEVFYDGRSLSRELARAGLAWWSKKYEPQDFDLKRLVEMARKQRKGLWKDDKPTPPWRHRWMSDSD